MAKNRNPRSSRRSLWRIPADWLKDESFYRDLVTGVLSTGLVAVIGYLYAMWAGYISTPAGVERMRQLKYAGLFLGWMLLLLIGMVGGGSLRSAKLSAFLENASTVLLFLTFGAMGLCIIHMTLVALPFWPFDVGVLGRAGAR